MRKILVIWAVLFMLLWAGGMLLAGLREVPPDAAVSYEYTPDFMLLVTGVYAGFLSCVGLFLFFFFGSIVRSLYRSRRH